MSNPVSQTKLQLRTGRVLQIVLKETIQINKVTLIISKLWVWAEIDDLINNFILQVITF